MLSHGPSPSANAHSQLILGANATVLALIFIAMSSLFLIFGPSENGV